MILKKAALLSLLILTAFHKPALAQQSPLPQSKEPLEVTADESLEWDRNNQIFTARKNAVAKQGDTAIKAATLTAQYRDNPATGNMEIYNMTAIDNVIIDSRDTKAFGDKAVYVLDKSLATLTGNNLRLVSPDQVITAQDRFEYWTNEGRLIAKGAAKVIRTNPDAQGHNDTLEADILTATMKNNEQGKRVLDTLQADGEVIITTATETLYGDHGIYRAGPNTAEITGNVKIRRGPNVLTGEKATVDLNTNISKLFGGAGSNGRVSGTFFPGSEKKESAN